MSTVDVLKSPWRWCWQGRQRRNGISPFSNTLFSTFVISVVSRPRAQVELYVPSSKGGSGEDTPDEQVHQRPGGPHVLLQR